MADNQFKIPLSHTNFADRESGAETLEIVSQAMGNSKYGNNNHDKDEKAQLDPNNLVSSQSEHRISDGQKRFRTLGKTTSSKYPRPKTLFKVFFEPNKEIPDIYKNLGYKNIQMGPDKQLCIELSNFVMSVTKPDIQYTTKEMNQYNRKKYIIEGVKYGSLKITFIDVKDNPIQQAFFDYLRKNNNDFKGNYKEDAYRNYNENNQEGFEDTNWGLNIDSSKHMFNSITICEMFLDRLMVYKIENPTLKSINFGENKIGDFGYNEITVTFDVEGITNILNYTDKDGENHNLGKDIIGNQIATIGGEKLAEMLGMRWYEGLGGEENQIDNKYLPSYINHKDQTIDASNRKIESAQRKQQEKMINYANQLVENDPNKTIYRWLPDDNDYSNNNVLDVLLGTVRNPQDIGKVYSPRIKQLTDYFKF